MLSRIHYKTQYHVAQFSTRSVVSIKPNPSKMAMRASLTANEHDKLEKAITAVAKVRGPFTLRERGVRFGIGLAFTTCAAAFLGLVGHVILIPVLNFVCTMFNAFVCLSDPNDVQRILDKGAISPTESKVGVGILSAIGGLFALLNIMGDKKTKRLHLESGENLHIKFLNDSWHSLHPIALAVTSKQTAEAQNPADLARAKAYLAHVIGIKRDRSFDNVSIADIRESLNRS